MLRKETAAFLTHDSWHTLDGYSSINTINEWLSILEWLNFMSMKWVSSTIDILTEHLQWHCCWTSVLIRSVVLWRWFFKKCFNIPMMFSREKGLMTEIMTGRKEHPITTVHDGEDAWHAIGIAITHPQPRTVPLRICSMSCCLCSWWITPHDNKERI